MSATALSRLRNLVSLHWAEVLWALFAIVSFVALVQVEWGETVPFHFIWVSLTLVYGLRLWRIKPTLVVFSAVTILSGAGLTWAVTHDSAGLDETTEIPLMGAMFLVMVWHVQRRQAAMDAMRRVAERELLLERDRNLVREVSHDLRTPIAVARGHAELIRSTHTGRQTADDAQVVVDQLDRLSRIAERLLILAAAEHPAFLTTGPVDVERVVVGAAQRWTTTAARRWHVEVRDEGLLLADEERLANSLDALIENAVRFTGEADEIAIGVRAENGAAVIAVSDTGDGIPAEDLPRIFERFSRAAAGRIRGNSGTGLGLAIVKAIAEAHGGRVTVKSELGKGTTFEIHLPGFQPGVEPPPRPAAIDAPLPPQLRTVR
jgi:signal transduction histidine kinase